MTTLHFIDDAERNLLKKATFKLFSHTEKLNNNDQIPIDIRILSISAKRNHLDSLKHHPRINKDINNLAQIANDIAKRARLTQISRLSL